MNIKEQLEQYIEKRAVEDSKMLRPQDNPLSMKQREFKAGANDIAELLLIACDALEKYNGFQLIKVDSDFYDDVEYEQTATIALNKIQEKIKGEL